MACEGCFWKGRGAVVVPEYSRTQGQWEYTKKNASFPPCDLQPDVFAELRGLANFAGRVLALTGHGGKKEDIQVVHQYGTDGIEIPHGTCIGRSITE